MPTGKCIIFIMNRKFCGFPSRIGGVALRTIVRQSEFLVCGICGLQVIGLVAIKAICGCTGIAALMTLQTFHVDVRPGEREIRGIVIESARTFTSRVAGKTGIAFINIAADTLMLLIRIGLVVLMAVDTTEQCVIRRICVTFRTVHPFALMRAAVNREIQSVMIKGGGLPGRFAMAGFAIRRKLRGFMIWIGSLIVLLTMTGKAGIGRIHVCTFMTCKAIAGNISVGALQHIIFVMHREKCRFPLRLRRMAFIAIVCKSQLKVIGICGHVVIFGMADQTNGRRAGITAFMAIQTIGGGVCAGERECGGIVIEAALRITGRMAGKAGRAVVHVSDHLLMLFIGLRLVMLVAVRTTEQRVTGRIGMAFGTGIPFAVVLSRINRKKLPVVLPEICRRPTGNRGVALRTFVGKTQRRMIGIFCSLIFNLMA